MFKLNWSNLGWGCTWSHNSLRSINSKKLKSSHWINPPPFDDTDTQKENIVICPRAISFDGVSSRLAIFLLLTSFKATFAINNKFFGRAGPEKGFAMKPVTHVWSFIKRGPQNHSDPTHGWFFLTETATHTDYWRLKKIKWCHLQRTSRRWFRPRCL